MSQDINWKEFEDKVICPHTGICHKHERCGGAIPHPRSACDPCPVHPGIECIPVCQFIGYARECLVNVVDQIKDETNYEKIVRQTTRSTKFLDDRIKYCQRTYDNFGKQF